MRHDELCSLAGGYCAHGVLWLSPEPSVRRETLRSIGRKFKLQPGSLATLDTIQACEAANLNTGLALRVLHSLPDLPPKVG